MGQMLASHLIEGLTKMKDLVGDLPVFLSWEHPEKKEAYLLVEIVGVFESLVEDKRVLALAGPHVGGELEKHCEEHGVIELGHEKPPGGVVH